MSNFNRLIKYNPLTVYLYNNFLDYRCEKVKGYIFVATTGRSGSESLSEILNSINNAICLHEPYPVMYNDYPDNIDRDKYFTDLFYKIKRINIKRAACSYSYYVETNHQFVKNFISHAIQCFSKKIRIIHLRRDPIKVAASFYSIDSIPGKTPVGKYYLIDPTDNENLIKVSDILYDNCEYSHDLYKCLWYWYEVETRIKKFKQQYTSIPWYTLQTDDLNNIDALTQMFKEFEITIKNNKLESLVGTRSNTKFDNKSQAIDFFECKSMHDKFLHLLEKKYGNRFWI